MTPLGAPEPPLEACPASDRCPQKRTAPWNDLAGQQRGQDRRVAAQISRGRQALYWRSRVWWRWAARCNVSTHEDGWRGGSREARTRKPAGDAERVSTQKKTGDQVLYRVNVETPPLEINILRKASSYAIENSDRQQSATRRLPLRRSILRFPNPGLDSWGFDSPGIRSPTRWKFLTHGMTSGICLRQGACHRARFGRFWQIF